MSEFSLVAAENSFLLEPDKLSFPRPGLWPSEASVEYEEEGRTVIEGKCMRASWFRAMGYADDGTLDPNMALKWDLGKSAEIFSIERWKRMGVFKASAVKFFIRELGVSGELDCIVKNPATGGNIGIECKSYYGHYANQEICGSKRPPVPGKPKIENLLQAAVYKMKYNELLEQYRLYYIERGDGHRVEFEVGLTPTEDDFMIFHRQIDGPYWGTFSAEPVYYKFTMNDVKQRFLKLRKHLADREIPPPDFQDVWDKDTIEWAWATGRLSKTKYEAWQKGKETPGAWQCRYCPFRNTCKNVER